MSLNISGPISKTCLHPGTWRHQTHFVAPRQKLEQIISFAWWALQNYLMQMSSTQMHLHRKGNNQFVDVIVSKGCFGLIPENIIFYFIHKSYYITVTGA